MPSARHIAARARACLGWLLPKRVATIRVVEIEPPHMTKRLGYFPTASRSPNYASLDASQATGL